MVEDEFIIAFDMEERLSALGASEVRVARSALEATKLVAAWRPAIALVDWRLADGVAGELVARLSAMGVGIVIVSGAGRSDIGIEETPSIAYVEKPVSDADLAAAVAGLLVSA